MYDQKPFYISEGLGENGINIRIGSRPEMTIHEWEPEADIQYVLLLLFNTAVCCGSVFYLNLSHSMFSFLTDIFRKILYFILNCNKLST